MRNSKTPGACKSLARNAVATLPFAFALALALALLCASFAIAAPENAGNAAKASAYTKSEMVYGMLESDGSLREAYVVNRFESDAPCEVDDYGAYTQVANLSTTLPLACNDGKVSLEKGMDPFFYQGVLKDAQLPWNVRFYYTLNGKSISPANLAGATGLLGIEVRTSANTQVNKAFYESFVLQVTITLDGDLCTDIKAKDATVAASGKDHTVAFTVLPGHDGNFKLTAQVKDFEMASAQIAALPYSSVVEMPDTSEMEDGLNSLTDAISQLNEGTDELADGVAQLSSGADSLADGAGEFGNGLELLASSSTQIVDASAQINSVLTDIASALENVDLSGIEDLPQYAPVLREIAESLDACKTVLQELDEDYARMAATLDYLASVVRDNALSEEEIANLRAEVADNEEAAEALEKLLATYDAVQEAVDEYYASGGSPETIQAQLEEFFAKGGQFDQIIDALNTAADFLESGGVDQIGQLVSGLSSLSSGYTQFHEGLVAYTDGVQTLSDNYSALSSGMSELAEGTSELSSGADQLSGGIAELDSATSDLPAQMRERMEEMMADYDFPEFKPVSFVDKRNKNVTAVQFVMLTDAIEIPEPEPVEPEPEPEPTIWDRFLNLIGLS